MVRGQRTAMRLSSTRWNAPSTVKTLLHTDMGGLLVALVSKFAEWTEEAFFFDGACLGALSGLCSI